MPDLFPVEFQLKASQALSSSTASFQEVASLDTYYLSVGNYLSALVGIVLFFTLMVLLIRKFT